MPGSAIAAALAAQQAARTQRRNDAEVARRRELRRAQRRPVVVERERHAFPCAIACLECGFMELPAGHGDPMRSDVTVIALPIRACRSCGQRAWADLAEVEVADALRDNERRDIELRGGIALAGLGVVASAGIVAVGVLGVVLGREIILTSSTIAIAAVLCVFMARRVWVGLTTPRRIAVRWRVPALLSRAAEVCGSGRAHGSAKQAPISGRSVIGWRVEVRYPGDRGGAFALVEQDCAGLSIGGHALGTEPTLATAATELRVERAEARRYLVSRGIDPNDRLEVRERAIADGDEVGLRTDALGGPAIVALR